MTDWLALLTGEDTLETKTSNQDPDFTDKSPSVGKVGVAPTHSAAPTSPCPQCGAGVFYLRKTDGSWHCAACVPPPLGSWSSMLSLPGCQTPKPEPGKPPPQVLLEVCQALRVPVEAVPLDYLADLSRPGWDTIPAETLRAHLVAYFREVGWPCH